MCMAYSDRINNVVLISLKTVRQFSTIPDKNTEINQSALIILSLITAHQAFSTYSPTSSLSA